MHFTHRKKKEIERSQLLRIGEQSIQWVPCVKFLDCDLGWSTYIDNLCSQLSQTCFVLFRLAESKCCEELLLRTRWATAKIRTRFLFRLQNKAMRTMLKMSRRKSCRNLLHELEIMLIWSILLVKNMTSELKQNCGYHDYLTRAAAKFSIPKYKRRVLTTFENNPY